MVIIPALRRTTASWRLAWFIEQHSLSLSRGGGEKGRVKEGEGRERFFLSLHMLSTYSITELYSQPYTE